MKYSAILAFVICCAFGMAARANAAGCNESNPFVQADALFTQAETAPSAKVHALWDQGTALMRTHHNDGPGRGCNAEEFDVRRLHALTHGLTIGYAWAGMDDITAADTADNIFTNTIYNIQSRDPFLDVDKDLRLHWGDEYNEIAQYRAHLAADAKAERLGRHVPANTSCGAPFSDVTAVNPVTPEFPEQAKRIYEEVTVLVTVSVGETGKVTGLELTRSSGNKWIDLATESAVLQTAFSPKIVNCAPVPGTYTFRSTFDPNH